MALTACAGSTPFDPKPVAELASPLAEPPPKAAVDCESPVDLKVNTLSAGAVERLWAQDRMALLLCRMRHAALREFYRDRDAGLAGR